MSARGVAIAALLGISLGCAAGYWAKSKLDDSDQVATSAKARSETAAGILETTSASVALGEVLATDATRIDQLQVTAAKRATKYLPKPNAKTNEKSTPEAPLAPPDRNCPGLVLDAGTVRLLNAARTGRLVVSAGGDAEKK